MAGPRDGVCETCFPRGQHQASASPRLLGHQESAAGPQEHSVCPDPAAAAAQGQNLWNLEDLGTMSCRSLMASRRSSTRATSQVWILSPEGLNF